MEIGQLKSKDLFVTGLVILILMGVGFWVNRMSPLKHSSQVNVPALSPSLSITEQNADGVEMRNSFISLGESRVAVKPAEGSTITSDDFSISTMAEAEQQEEFLTLLQAYQQGNDLEGYTKLEKNNRVIYINNETNTANIFFGDIYLVQFSEGLIDSVQFTAPFLSRYGKMELFKKLFADKYAVSVDSIEIGSLWVTDAHARGEVKIQGDTFEGGIFFGVKKDQEWELAYDGNGTYECSLLLFHAFPEQMQEGCIE